MQARLKNNCFLALWLFCQWSNNGEVFIELLLYSLLSIMKNRNCHLILFLNVLKLLVTLVIDKVVFCPYELFLEKIIVNCITGLRTFFVFNIFH